MGDMLLSHESNEMMLDSQSGSPLFAYSPHPLEDIRGRVPLVSGNTMLLIVGWPTSWQLCFSKQ
jgi:hypothetical protein